jgi:subtilisin family serine protease
VLVFTRRILFCIAPVLILSSCAPERSEKEFLPYVIQNEDGVKAISAEEAKTLCAGAYCEKNQIYTSQFGRKRHQQPVPPPMPIQEPPFAQDPFPQNPVQPPEVLDYSRAVLNMDEAWNYTEGSREVLVAVIDSGVQQDHPDLKVNLDEINGYDFYHDRPGAEDENGHGTHVSGIIAAAKDTIGTRGVAPQVRILPLKFLGPSGSGDTADAVRAVDYAILKGAKVISNSWGGAGYSELLNQAVQRAVSAGIYFVAAAGNEKRNNDEINTYPANYPNVISVGSSGSWDNKSSFSNYGSSSVMIFAPGSNIYSSYPGDSYRLMSGTSMAAPQVSGAIALALSLKPNIERSAVRNDLCGSSVTQLREYSVCGRMDVGHFIRKISTR